MKETQSFEIGSNGYEYNIKTLDAEKMLDNYLWLKIVQMFEGMMTDRWKGRIFKDVKLIIDGVEAPPNTEIQYVFAVDKSACDQYVAKIQEITSALFRLDKQVKEIEMKAMLDDKLTPEKAVSIGKFSVAIARQQGLLPPKSTPAPGSDMSVAWTNDS